MNDIYLLEKTIDDLENECYQLNQQVQEMYGNINVHTDNNMKDKVMYNSYPTPIENPLDLDENMINTLSYYNENIPDNNQSLILNSNSNTFDPIMVSNEISQNVNVGSEPNDEKLFSLLMAIQEMNKTNIINNAPLGNSCNEIDFDLAQNLLSMQENSVNDSIPMDISVESILAEIQNNHVSLLGGSYSYSEDGDINNEDSLEEYIVSNDNFQTISHKKLPI